MAITKTATTVFSNQTVSGYSSTTGSSSIDLTTAIDFAIGYTLTFPASGSGARIDVYADPTGANSGFSVGTYDDPIDSYTITHDNSHTVNGMIPMNKAAKYVKIKLANLSSSNITGATLTAIVQHA